MKENKGKRKGPGLAEWVDDCIAEYKGANAKDSKIIENDMVKLLSPLSDKFKIHTGVAINVEVAEVRIGAVCKDAEGR